jgi:hypothetical protein
MYVVEKKSQFFSCKIMVFFIEKVHILRITHFFETTKDGILIFGMGGDANVKLCIQHFLSPGLGPIPLGNLLKKMYIKIPSFVVSKKCVILKICTFSIKKTMILQEKNNRLI